MALGTLVCCGLDQYWLNLKFSVLLTAMLINTTYVAWDIWFQEKVRSLGTIVREDGSSMSKAKLLAVGSGTRVTVSSLTLTVGSLSINIRYILINSIVSCYLKVAGLSVEQVFVSLADREWQPRLLVYKKKGQWDYLSYYMYLPLPSRCRRCSHGLWLRWWCNWAWGWCHVLVFWFRGGLHLHWLSDRLKIFNEQ